MNSRFKFAAAGAVCGFAMMVSTAMAAPTLVHRYSFNDGAAKDSVGKSDGKLVGGVKVADGKATFNGTAGQRIELLSKGADGININGFKAITLEAWYTADKEQTWQRVFDFGASKGLDEEGTFGSNCLHFIVNSGPGDTRAVISNNDPSFQSEAVASATTAPLNKELHLSVVVDDKNITLYMNGAKMGTTALDGRTLAKLSNDYALLGDSMYGGDPSFSGSINEFRIYDGAATDADVKASFDAGPDKK